MGKSKKFAQVLRAVREERGLSYRALSKMMGVSAGLIVQYEKSLSFPSPAILEKLCQVFGWDFKSTYLAIQDERDSDKILSKYFQAAKPEYPDLRKIFLDLYKSDFRWETSYDTKDDAQWSYLIEQSLGHLKYATKKEIKDELEKYSRHPIETCLISTIYRIVHHDWSDGQEDIPAYYKKIKDDQTEQTVKNIISFWTYSILDQTLQIRHKVFDEKSSEKFKITTYRFRPVRFQEVPTLRNEHPKTNV